MFGKCGRRDNCSGGPEIDQTQPEALTLALKLETWALPPARRRWTLMLVEALSKLVDLAGTLMDTPADCVDASEANDGALLLKYAAPWLLMLNCTSYSDALAPAGSQRPEATTVLLLLPPPVTLRRML